MYEYADATPGAFFDCFCEDWYIAIRNVLAHSNDRCLASPFPEFAPLTDSLIEEKGTAKQAPELL